PRECGCRRRNRGPEPLAILLQPGVGKVADLLCSGCNPIDCVRQHVGGFPAVKPGDPLIALDCHLEGGGEFKGHLWRISGDASERSLCYAYRVSRAEQKPVGAYPFVG